MKTIVARWESKSGKHWVEIYHQETEAFKGYGFNESAGGGWLGDITEEDAINKIASRVNDFQPDKNKTPMIRMPI